MRAFVLIVVYLTRDTLHRWATRFSSPLARLLVVFFLSFCGLAFLCSYVISVKALRQRINSGGADVVVAAEMVADGEGPAAAGDGLIPPRPQEYRLLVFREAFVSAMEGEAFLPLVELPPSLALLVAPGARRGLLVLPARERAAAGRLPTQVRIEGFAMEATLLPEAEAGVLRKLYPGGAALAPWGCLPGMWRNGFIRKYVLQVKCADAERVGSWERALRLLARLERRQMTVVGSSELLKELAEMEATQYRFRVWVTLGIAAVICLLLTSISSLEYQQNQYVYALLGSFGVSRPMLFGAFLLENTVLVGAGFGGALAALWGVRGYVTERFFRMPGLTLGLWELEADIRTFCLAFGICVLVSGLPILAAILRPIGKVLK